MTIKKNINVIEETCFNILYTYKLLEINPLVNGLWFFDRYSIIKKYNNFIWNNGTIKKINYLNIFNNTLNISHDFCKKICKLNNIDDNQLDDKINNHIIKIMAKWIILENWWLVLNDTIK